MTSFADTLFQSIRALPRAQVFTSYDFEDIGTPAQVGQGLRRLAAAGKIRALDDQGFYDCPSLVAPVASQPWPAADELMAATARRFDLKYQPEPERCLAALSLIARPASKRPAFYYADINPNRWDHWTVYLPGSEVSFLVKPAPEALAPWLGRPGGVVISALLALGVEGARKNLRPLSLVLQNLSDEVLRDLTLERHDITVPWIRRLLDPVILHMQSLMGIRD